jgi:choline dehydrogenase
LETDYLIIGGGAAGCAAAHVLAQDPSCTVTLVESGGTNDRPDVSDPSAYLSLMTSDAVWGYKAVPRKETNFREHSMSMGRLLGGSSSVNGMMVKRGAPSDYDRWEAAGNPGWDSASVNEAFRALESYRGPELPGRGSDGPLAITKIPDEHPLTAAYLAACREVGYKASPSFSDDDPEGFATHELNVLDGKRQDAGTAFLAGLGDSFTLVLGTTVNKLNFDPSHSRVLSVEAVRDGEPVTFSVNRDVVLCAGAVATPQLLLLSGVGDPAELEELGIEVEVPLSGVGRNFHDHVSATVAWKSPKPIPPSHFQGVETGLFLRSSAEEPQYDAQMPMKRWVGIVPDGCESAEDGFSFFAGLLTPESRGTVRLRSADPTDLPLVDPAYLAEPRDLERLANIVEAAREIGAASAFDEWRTAEIAPGPACETREQLLEYVRSAATTSFHPAGTCRMGPDPSEGAVVDHRLSVYGVDNLHVADASIMPDPISGCTNVPAMMIGWRGGEFVRDAAQENATLTTSGG